MTVKNRVSVTERTRVDVSQKLRYAFTFSNQSVRTVEATLPIHIFSMICLAGLPGDIDPMLKLIEQYIRIEKDT